MPEVPETPLEFTLAFSTAAALPDFLLLPDYHPNPRQLLRTDLRTLRLICQPDPDPEAMSFASLNRLGMAGLLVVEHRPNGRSFFATPLTYAVVRANVDCYDGPARYREDA